MVETDNSGVPKVTVLDFGACERIPAGKPACLLAFEPLALGRLCALHMHSHHHTCTVSSETSVLFDKTLCMLSHSV